MSLFITVIIVFVGFRSVEAGTCWQYYNATRGKCFGLISRYTRNECCDKEQESFYRERRLSDKENFFHFTNGVSDCVPCSFFTTPANRRDLCKGVKCPQGKVCRVKGHTRTKCVCPKRRCKTLRTKRPVCGSDGKTYRNKCFLNRRACKEARPITVAYNGRCRDSCDTVECQMLPGGQKQSCLVDKKNRAHCVSCEKLCEGKQHLRAGEVCGKNGLTYANRCELRKATCMLGKSIGIAYYGKCEQRNCMNVTCPTNQKCVPDENGNPRCVTCSCSSNFSNFRLTSGFLCGSDGNTYKGQCAMDQQSCKIGRLIEIKNYGTCKEALKQFLSYAQIRSSVPPSVTTPTKTGSIAELQRALNRLGKNIRFISESDIPMTFNITSVLRRILKRLEGKKGKANSTIPLKDGTT